MKEDNKKHKKTKNGNVDPHIVKSSTNININEAIANINTGDSALNLVRGASVVDILGATNLKNNYLDVGVLANPTIDILRHEAIYAKAEPLTLATQAGILGVNALGENLVEMQIKTISDARNFMVGVNNVASVFSENSGLLKSIESASATVMNHSKLMTEAMYRIDMSSITRSIEIAKEYNLKANEVFKLSESVTTVLAYGQAVQSQFDTIVGSELFKNGATVLRNSSIALGKISDHIPVYADSEYITSPFVFEPRTVKTKEVEKALPKVKKELPAKTTEAIELMEYVFDPSTKNDDNIITTKVSELKRALKNMQGSVAMFIQQTTQKVEITSMPIVQTFIEKGTPHTNKFPFKIPAGTTWQNITIQFTNTDTVNIQVAGHSHQTGYADMGFVDNRTSKPTIQWGLLSLLAKGGGELLNSSSDTSDNYKKHKQLLSEKLRDYFNIESDPFEPYKGGYKTRMTLVPPPVKKGETKNDYSITDEVDDMFRNLTEE
ncbi:MAG: hypothetical protein WC087_04150 [Candidatus Paceibacterota bacterium]